MEEVEGEKITVQFDGRRCIHARHSVLGQPGVFRANVQGPWIHPDAASVAEVMEVAHACPSGAIRYTRRDGGPDEQAPRVNVARVRENGPLAFHADVAIAGQDRTFRATLCRCGRSANKPFCDGAHAGSFTASGEPETTPSEPLAARDGVVRVTPRPNGPLIVEGNLELCAGTGRTQNRVTRAALCRCGGSSKKPYCDGTHAKIGFEAP